MGSDRRTRRKHPAQSFQNNREAEKKRHTGFRESSTRKPYSRISATRMDWHLSRAAKAA